MPSRARQAFDENIKDIDRLFGFHLKSTGGTLRPQQTEVLNKSAVVLLTAFWEAYCEDLAAEALEHLVQGSVSWADVPLSLQKRVAKELKQNPHELAIWRLAGDGWRDLLTGRLVALQEERNRRLNTPKTAEINRLFEEALGIERISQYWKWNSTSAAQAESRLDRYVTLRGEIAHRGSPQKTVSRAVVKNYVAHVKRLVARTGGRVNLLLRKATGEFIWLPTVLQALSELSKPQVAKLRKRLTSQESKVLKARLGKDEIVVLDQHAGATSRTLTETASSVRLGADQVRRIESAILLKIRQIEAPPEHAPGSKSVR